MNILFLLVGFFAGLIFSWYFLSKKAEENKKLLELEREEKIKLRTELENNLKNQQNNDNQFKESIESYVLNAMQLNNENFINLAKKTLERYFVEADKGLQNKTLEIEKIIEPLQKSLEKYDKKIVDFQKDTEKGLGGISTYLKELTSMQNELTKQTNTLVGALKSPRIRGRWGEIGLRRIVEFSGLNEYCDFTEQQQTEIDRLRPDMVINLPENRKIIVDSKLPLEAYISAFETDDELQKKTFLKNHLKAVRDNMRLLSSKNYRQKFAESIDFVVMYIEVEPALTAALIQDTNLINEALKFNIIIATPTTFVALLQTVAFGWRQYKLSENAQLILKEAQEFYERVGKFTDHFQKIGKTIGSLEDDFNKAVGSWQNRVEPSMRRIEQLGIKDNKKEVQKIDSNR
ncbi:MAG: DNA recombination protein RmuC [Bacteroidales bacterium]|nr:DNA recombination protein RmuC [Bacteroidales bacterium]